jgi:FlgD Ig-like domain
MKIRLCIIGMSLLLLLIIPSRTLSEGLTEVPDEANYINLVNQTEKWFTSGSPGKSTDMRLHTAVKGTYNGAVIQERELLSGGDIVSSQKLLFSRTEAGDILFHGDMETRILSEPILWVDAPLSTGKSWTAQAPAGDKSIDPDQMIHYVFACLSEDVVNCPQGVFPAFRVFQATIFPDGTTTSCSFWYNENCGVVRCCLEDEQDFLLSKTITGNTDEPDVELEDPLPLGAASVPNPANPLTSIQFRLGDDAAVGVQVFDVAGRLVKTLVADQVLDAGLCRVPWNGTDESGRLVSSGTYLYRVRAGKASEVGRVTIVR